MAASAAPKIGQSEPVQDVSDRSNDSEKLSSFRTPVPSTKLQHLSEGLIRSLTPETITNMHTGAIRAMEKALTPTLYDISPAKDVVQTVQCRLVPNKALVEADYFISEKTTEAKGLQEEYQDAERGPLGRGRGGRLEYIRGVFNVVHPY